MDFAIQSDIPPLRALMKMKENGWEVGWISVLREVRY